MNQHTLTDQIIGQIGKKFADVRHQKAEKITTVAQAAGISHSTLSLIENGRYPSLKVDTVMKLCSHLGIPFNDLVDY